MTLVELTLAAAGSSEHSAQGVPMGESAQNGDTGQHLLPCPSWCDGHPVDESFWADLEIEEAVVSHEARVGKAASHRHSNPWMDPGLFVWVRRHDSYLAGEVTIGSPKVMVKECWCDTTQETAELAADLLAAAAILREAQR